jgi:hypothetical protein
VGPKGAVGAQGPQGQKGVQGPTGPKGQKGSVDSCGTLTEAFTNCGACGFSGNPPDDTGYTAVGWIAFNIGGTDYYVPAWA